jgi:hypothetical protein
MNFFVGILENLVFLEKLIVPFEVMVVVGCYPCIRSP